MESQNHQALSGNKRIAKNTLFLYIRMGLSMAISLYTSRIVLKELGIDDFGLYNVVAGVVVMLAFVNGALAVSTQRYLSFEMGKTMGEGRVRLVFNQTLYIHLLLGLIVIIFAESVGLWFLNNKMVIPFGSENSAFWVYQFSVCTVFLSVLQVPFTSMIIAKESMSVYAYVGLLEVFIKLLIAFTIGVFSSDGVIWYSGLILGAALTNFLIYIFYCYKKINVSRLLCKIDGKIIKSLCNFASWSLFGAVAWTGKNQGLNVLLNLFFGTTINAAYGITNQVNSAVNGFVQNFSVAVAPQIVKSFSAENYTRMNKLIVFGSKISFLLLFLLALPMAIAIEPILDIWLVDVPADTSIFIRLILCVSLLESFTYAMGNAIQATGKIKVYQALIGCTILANLPISWALLKIGAHAQIVFIVSIGIALCTLAERIWLMNRLIPNFSLKNILLDSILPCFSLLAIGVVIIYISIRLTTTSSLLLWVGVPGGFLGGVILVMSIGLSVGERKRIISPIQEKLTLLKNRKTNG